MLSLSILIVLIIIAFSITYFCKRIEHLPAFADRLVLLTSSEPREYFFRGITQHQLGNFEESLRDINQAVCLNAKQNSSFKLEHACTKFALQDFSIIETLRFKRTRRKVTKSEF